MDESTKSASRSSTFTTQEKEDWKLENSSLWWLSLDFFQNPGTVLLISSIPLSLGAYYGFVQPGENLEKWVGDAPTNVEVQSPKSNRMVQRALEKEIETMAARQLGLQVASKALGVATFATLGTFSILGAGEPFVLEMDILQPFFSCRQHLVFFFFGSGILSFRM